MSKEKIEMTEKQFEELCKAVYPPESNSGGIKREWRGNVSEHISWQ